MDRAVTGAADAGGFKILVADEAKAYAWKTVAVLAEPGLPADSWIGNTCVMDKDHAAAVYAPRTFTNKPDLMQGGAFAAVVNLTTGQVTKLPFTATLAYFDPSCNTATHQAAFTAFRDMDDPANMKTRLVTVDTAGRPSADTVLAGEVTSAVPVKGATVAARGHSLVRIDHTGRLKSLAKTDNVPFDVRPTTAGQVAFLDRRGDSTARAKIWRGHGESALIAKGTLGDLALHQGDQGKVFLTGHPAGAPNTTGTGVTRLNAPADADVSTGGRLAVGQVITPGIRRGLARIKDAGRNFDKNQTVPSAQKHAAPTPETVGSDQPTTVASTSTATGKKITQAVADTTSGSGNAAFSPALTGTRAPAAGLRTGAVSHDPTDPDRWCSVPRNDIKSLALQPTPNQVEWAVDMAVRGELHAQWITQGGWRDESGLGTVDPQGLFPRPSLAGGGRIPANVLLGVMAQESNLWQAEPGSIPGQMGNPLASYDGFYGHKQVDGDPDSHWTIHWDLSDCGYGVGQVTDGMRMAGHEKPNETALPAATQRAIALDYAVNIAASMYILADKWNEIHEPGQTLTLNNDDATKPENWFAALWNYNSGMNDRSDAGTNGNWGLGWYNNPANPSFKPDRKPFLDSKLDPDGWAKDPAHPQDWPYEEKVLGWAAWSIDTGFSYATSGRQDWPGESGYATAGFQPAWWTSDQARSELKPPLDTFCNSHNTCDSANPPHCPDAACYAKYWWHETNATWKNCAAPASACGNESIKYATLRAEPGRGTRLQTGPPVCTTTGAPSASLIVNSMPDNTNTYSDCKPTGTDAGSFQFTFNADPNATGPGLGQYDAKADLHQVGGGYNGHFWFAHTRDIRHLGGDSGRMTITGTWTLNQNVSWARVLVHLPDTGAQTRQAIYHIGGSDSISPGRIVEQRANRWVSLGAFHFTGTPSVTLTNATDDGTADEDIAWDAVAFQPLPDKPNNVVVAMGDSYSSGEGASDPGGDDYYPESDFAGKGDGDELRDDCHRSKYAWTRRAVLPGEVLSTAELDDVNGAWSARMDYHLIACSGARHYNILYASQAGELPQIRQGYLDQNTTLVALSIGGNDMAFADIITKCVLAVTQACQDASIDERNPDTGEKTGNSTPPLKDWAPAWAHGTVRPRLVKTLTELHTKAPHAKIVLMGYPRLLENAGQCVPGIGTAEGPWLNRMADTVAKEMKGAVDDANEQSQVNAVFADPRNAFAGQAICGNPETIHGIVFTGRSKADTAAPKPSMKSFHPKVSGTLNYATAFVEALAQ